MEAGTITVGMGYNVWAGGDNKPAFEVVLYLRGGTLQIDCKAVVEGGSLKVPR